MRNFLAFIFVIAAGLQYLGASEPAEGYLFSYTTTADEGRGGLLFAWSVDGREWHGIGQGFSFVKSDYGSWGSEKRMIRPVVFPAGGGGWTAFWQLDNGEDGPVAVVHTSDMLYWGRQAYYTGVGELDGGLRAAVGAAELVTARMPDGAEHLGTVVRVPWAVIDGMIRHAEVNAYRQGLWSELAKDDPVRFAGLEPVSVSVRPRLAESKPISDMLMGIFFEDINYAADGGLYAELVQNRGFEYDLSDKLGRDTSWHARKAWSAEGLSFGIDTVAPVHPNQKHYAVLSGGGAGGRLVNEGFGGIAVKAGAPYDFSMFGRVVDGAGGSVLVRLVAPDGGVLGSAEVELDSAEWEQVSAVIEVGAFTADARLEIEPQFGGTLALDMVSLFPRDTYKGRRNGLRRDLAEAIEALKPRFVRFPGGCVAHGNGIENIYHWKNTIGPLEARKGQRNLWNYHQSGGLGYYEYFLFCEDIGAEPVPVVAAGVPCQNSHAFCHELGGQQGGIPMCEMGAYVQDVLDLIEWANGGPDTVWGRVRAELGHPEPFNLKYVGIGNEDLITDVFEERFTMIYEALREKYPEITVIGTAGPFFEGTDYVEGWKIAGKLGVPVMDEHYYQTPGWFIYNQDFYDKYDRQGGKVYLGEYAAHLPGRISNMESALAEALYLTSLERNGDVVCMSSYAPLLAKEGNTQWRPDLIYFNNTEVKPTVNYYVQQLFGQNAGDRYIPADVAVSQKRRDVASRIAFSIVEDPAAGEVILKAVNMLPVEVTVTDYLGGLPLTAAGGVKTVFAGTPADDSARPVESVVSLEEVAGLVLEPYSLTVIRMPVAGR